ncbi:MAG: cobyric acid synthase [Pseudomonadota bacterium]
MAKSIMIQGAGSNVGKSIIVAGLCRAAKARGLRVAPFKPQNMSNNAMVTDDGGEIGRAQALQARACGIPLSVDMNPVLLKPEADNGSQVIVQGQRLATVKARDYADLKPQLIEKVLQSFQRLKSEFDLLIVEGAGSPAEVNLRAGDIANMGFAEVADVPVVLIGDIDRGGVIAQLVGTQTVLDTKDAARIKGFLVNKFRGDITLFDAGMDQIAKRTGWSALGVVPWFGATRNLPAEDSLDIAGQGGDGSIRIAVPRLPRIANFDDLDPLGVEPAVELIFIEEGNALPGDIDLVILPGSKSTLSDLEWLISQGWDVDLAAHLRRGGRILGLCGGYQMLGKTLSDPDGIEGEPGQVKGLGLLDIDTIMTAQKRLEKVQAQAVTLGNTEVKGYEIHIGRSNGPDCARPFLRVDGRPEGAISASGQVIGSYVHGMFAEDHFRSKFLYWLGAPGSNLNFEAMIDETLDDLARHLAAHLDLDALFALAE